MQEPGMFSNQKKKKSNKDKNFYPCGPGHVVILAQDGRMGNAKDVEAINSVFLEMGKCAGTHCKIIFWVQTAPKESYLLKIGTWET